MTDQDMGRAPEWAVVSREARRPGASDLACGARGLFLVLPT